MRTCAFFVVWQCTTKVPIIVGVRRLLKICFINIVFILVLCLHILQLFDFIHLEDFFEMNFIAYELDGKVAKLVQRSRELYKETMRLNVYENHLSVIVDFKQYCGVYQCIHCDKLWDHSGHYDRHTKSCTTMVREVFPGLFIRILPPFLKN